MRKKLVCLLLLFCLLLGGCAAAEGLTVTDDLMTVDVDTGSAIFECKIHFNGETRGLVDTCAEVGNYILRSGDGENEFYTINEA